MGLFDSKATRIAKHQQLIDLARSTLEQLQIGTYKGEDDKVTSPVWTDEAAARIPLEYRSWISLHLETLVCAVHDTEQDELGSRDWIRELAESLNFTRFVMAGPPRDVKLRFRAEAFARFQSVLTSELADLAHALATDGWVSIFTDGIERTIRMAETARSWFTDQKELDEADALLMARQKREFQKPYLHEMDRLLKDAGVALAKAKAHIEGTRQAREQAKAAPSEKEP